MAKFFIDRPVFAWVIAILIMLAGAMSVLNLPIQQYPTIAPPSIRIVAQYPGASADTLEESVTQIIEQNMTGIEPFGIHFDNTHTRHLVVVQKSMFDGCCTAILGKQRWWHG